jgi:RNA polymerase sigma-70 factor (ECF subfamily)
VAIPATTIEAVYRRRHRAFRNAIACVAGSYELADDVVQEAFARALAHRRQFRGDGDIEAWIWRIALRTALEMRAEPRASSIDQALDPGIVDVSRDPELAAAIRTLPPRRRLLVFLRYVADLSYRDIARICSVSEGTVAATLAQARADLAKELGYRADSYGPNSREALHGRERAPHF